ncbi:DUF6415 family natural product biosynthesis protein [Streptomyces sp. NPDC096310]|uniref:DUF6415 family natural product biosynthesis protein n=1 Tax=Streptomyces sp. NPDC096310 TaxID=3366082 RepID=UPI00381C030F
MTAHSETRPTTSAIQATLAEAAALGGTRADLSELAAIGAELRRHIAALLPAAEAHVEGLWRGGQEWYGRRSRLDNVQRHVTEQMTSSPLSAQVYVAILLRDCTWLLEHYGNPPREGR